MKRDVTNAHPRRGCGTEKQPAGRGTEEGCVENGPAAVSQLPGNCRTGPLYLNPRPASASSRLLLLRALAMGRKAVASLSAEKYGRP